jgi:hypothetical protein
MLLMYLYYPIVILGFVQFHAVEILGDEKLSILAKFGYHVFVSNDIETLNHIKNMMNSKCVI